MNEAIEAFTYSLAGETANQPVPPPSPTPILNVPEPSTFLLLGASLVWSVSG
ncbi:MAG: PEP-CTERM sorting domain-containing protein [Candidatus Thiodiazotropha endolucinida]|nr:PEP-CTERM sorting domain-containing protein [Candidatus Thiodiazotropha taylori]MCW4226884.1 PEP-CTERM sorting domain-containing protein [Candidatus Thiodiazotropha endolucinida]MCG7882098.1 PEP-CTERM sorting domain-containing protein [Candidatus Thiodiazotropha taylori]MCG7888446.1 PEP-CTERM sorting domain-containing protein [Candidatus Thiodiazotropha taylori]MCG7890758.1 PEP-CTERM sorting domain-containing protein [Candidatus Thiodiazotropha taylori]